MKVFGAVYREACEQDPDLMKRYLTMLGACPTSAIRLRRTMRWHLRRSLPAAQLRQAGRPTKNAHHIAANTPPVFRGLRPRTLLPDACRRSEAGQAPPRTAEPVPAPRDERNVGQAPSWQRKNSFRLLWVIR